MKKSILFVSTENLFESISAEYLFKQYLKENNISNWIVSSAGTITKKEGKNKKIKDILTNLGIKDIYYKQKKLKKKLLKKYDIIIAMTINSKNMIEKKFNYNYSFLFNSLAINEESSIFNIKNENKNFNNNIETDEQKIKEIIFNINKKIPLLYKNVDAKFYLFSEFVLKERTHKNGFPIIFLNETKNTIAFMSKDIPSKENYHILVIPKKRYIDIEDIPKIILNELIQVIQKIGNSLTNEFEGYNILLNNGISAGQYIMHVHFHIIIRNYSDKIKIESWRKKEISKEDFISLNNNIKEILKKEI